MLEKTLIILKPDCMNARLAGQVMDRFYKEGFKMAACKMMSLSDVLLKEHYAHLADKPFFPRIQEFMQSAPVLILILEGENVITRVRDLLGPTNSEEAPKGTIRGDLGTDVMLNIAHASDGSAAAVQEIERFFRPQEVFSV